MIESGITNPRSCLSSPAGTHPDSLSAPSGRVLKQVLGAWSIHRPLGVYSGQSLERRWASRVLKQVLDADRTRGAVSVFSASDFTKKTKIQ